MKQSICTFKNYLHSTIYKTRASLAYLQLRWARTEKYEERKRIKEKLEIPSVTNASNFYFTNIWLPKTFKMLQVKNGEKTKEDQQQR